MFKNYNIFGEIIMQKNTQEKLSSNHKRNEFNIAIDLGYGDEKIYYEQKMIKFPNAVATAGISVVNMSNSSQIKYNFEGVDYVVGEQALLNAPLKTRNFSYLKEYSPLLVYKVLKDIGINPSDKINLVCGLSIKDWGSREDFAKRLESNVFVNSEHYNNITVKLIPQGVGIYEYYKKKYKHLIKEDFYAVLDIGYNTLDFFIFKDGNPIDNMYFANTNGVNLVATEIVKLITKNFGLHISEQDAKVILKDKSFKAHNVVHDLSLEINKLIKGYAKQIINEITNHNQLLLSKVNGVIIAGGGAYLLKDSGITMFEHEIYPDIEFEYANVVGYYQLEFENE
jgi:plasmid segregation protein ParM